MTVLLEVNIIPIGKVGGSLSAPLAEVLKIVQDRGVNYELSPMGTTLEGDLDTLLALAREMHEVCFTLGYPRVVTTIKIDDRRDKDVSMQAKVNSIEEKLAE